ncbi:MAG: hypothetical protein JWO53_1311, partial [Chlamydiia bacterium]|nr:hypothetical protein [Chlamydiia bacterium]
EKVAQEGRVNRNSAIRYQANPHAADEHFLLYREAATHFDAILPTPRIEVVGENPEVD